ncbi:FxLD family lantipeptide [Kribbella sandramycini]|uniref:FxLD family lantipeptide n=1 Tax=Kribbella sandramycini TaxID=60450 RepID=A0A7Y4KXM1_9ACTN|nr:FxLD family lanthipeptide [Kribbella sandramycini]MBB6569621.1 FxLD family lantipeptide [Kribbella sandramycini]NOL40544.1 FxLD family lantipeptide [Kribbella sandramycini]
MDLNQSLDSEFELDVRVVTDVVPEANAGCNTDDGCAASCASSCASNV